MLVPYSTCKGGRIVKYEMVEHSDTFSNILEKISRMDSPVGIMLFGADSKSKEMLFHRIIQQSDMLFGEQMYSRGGSSLELSETERIVASNGGGILIKLSGDASTRYGGRHRVVMGMHNDGMQSIVGIYVKVAPSSSESQKQQAVLENHPPTADGLTALVTVTTSS